jgi:membrane-associated protease RseP (regulator of RpoE activity)
MIDKKGGFLGVQIQDLSEQLSDYFKVKNSNGVLVSEVVDDSPAEKAGLKAGDIIVKIDGADIKNAGDLTMTIRQYEPKTEVSVSVVRNGKKKQLKATLGESEKGFAFKFGDLKELSHRGPQGRQKMLLKMHPEGLEEFEFQGFPFEKEKFQQQMEEMRKDLYEMQKELQLLKESN